MPIPRARRMNLIALALFVAALIPFGVFHFQPSFFLQDEELLPGWFFWTILAETFSVDDAPLMMTGVSFVTATLLLVSSPFLLRVLRLSRLAWWFVTIISGFALMGLGGILTYFLIAEGSQLNEAPTISILYLATAQLLHLAGLFFIRREEPPRPQID